MAKLYILSGRRSSTLQRQDAMEQFKISEEGYKKFRKKWFTTMLPLVGVIVAGAIIMNSIESKPEEFNTLPFVIPFVVLLLGFSFYRSIRKQKKFLLSYSVTISRDGITREQLDTPPLTISSIEIREIIKTKKGGFTVKGVDRTDVINIPYLIDNVDLLEQRLQALAPVAVNTKDPFYRKYGAVLFLVALGMMLCVYTVTDKIIVGICGTLLTGLFVWAFYEMRTSKNIPSNTKRTSWFFLIVIVSIIYMTYAKLTGNWVSR